MHDRK